MQLPSKFGHEEETKLLEHPEDGKTIDSSGGILPLLVLPIVIVLHVFAGIVVRTYDKL